MLERLFLGIDQGSSSTKGILIDMQGQHHQEFSVPVSSHVIDDNTVEQDPDELLRSVRHVADEAIRFAQRTRRNVVGIGLSFQRSGVCAWDAKTGEVLHPLISHRDRRTQGLLEDLRESHETITKKSGLPVISNYAGGKIALLQKEFPDERAYVATLDSFIVQRFAGDSRFQTEDSMAARTMLYSLELNNWDSQLCEIFSVDAKRLPAINASLDQHGTYRGIPITAMLGDQQAGLFGRLAEGMQILLNLGTISSLCVCTQGSPIFNQGFVTSVLYSDGGIQREFKYLIEGVTGSSGAIIDFLLNQIKAASGVEELTSICLEAETQDGAAGPIAYFPKGLSGTPHWRSDLPDVVVGWDSGNVRALVRPLIEDIGGMIADNIIALDQAGILNAYQKSIAVSGGLSDLDFLMQYIADISGFELVRLGTREATARGAAIAAMSPLQRSKERSLLPRDRERMHFVPRKGVSIERFKRWKSLRDRVIQGEVSESELYTHSKSQGEEGSS